jgi:hypothetical protein
MTYIVAGKTKDNTFLMADCIVTNSIMKINTIRDKVIKLDSSENETYFTLCGNPFIENCIRTLDLWFNLTNRTNDFINGETSFNSLVEIIGKTLNSYKGEPFYLKENRLFFIDKNDVVYYDLKFSNSNILIKKPEKNILFDNYDIDSNLLSQSEPFYLNNDTIEIYCQKCLEHSLKLSKKDYEFKNRFTFINFFNNDIIYKYPYKRISDIIADFNEIEYSKIDDEDFIWNLP